MHLDILQPFGLIVETALLLKYGHRTSIDIDLFYHEKFNNDDTLEALKKKFGNGLGVESKSILWGIFCYINDVKVDIVYNPYLPIRNMAIVANIRMFANEDIIAMKLIAILGRGQKKTFGFYMNC